MPASPTDHAAALIAELRARGLSPQEIARLTGLSRSTVWRLANGEGAAPGYATVFMIEAIHAKRCK